MSSVVNVVPRSVTPLSILVKYLDALRIAQESNVPTPITVNLQKALRLIAGIDPYLEACTTAESPALVVAQFNSVVADDPHVEQVLLPVRAGLTIMRRV